MQTNMHVNNSSAVIASTVAGTDYFFRNSGESVIDYNKEDGVNIGRSNDEIDDSESIMNINHHQSISNSMTNT
jgi:hypothetical protein